MEAKHLSHDGRWAETEDFQVDCEQIAHIRLEIVVVPHNIRQEHQIQVCS